MSYDMKQISEISVRDYSYALPPERIAFYPKEPRDASNMLVMQNGRISDETFRDIHHFLETGSLLVMNNTKVVQARLEFFKITGARIEIFCLEPLHPVRDVQLALGNQSPVRWLCLVGNLKKWKSGTLFMEHGGVRLEARLVEQQHDGYIVEFSWLPEHLGFGEVLDAMGKTPLPPYISRDAEWRDRSRYQTVFAMSEGSVAAPTAGLHFSPPVMEALAQKGIEPEFVTLHVGAGTFKPVTAKHIGGHHMHQEQFAVDCSLIEKLLGLSTPLVCVGTTSMRTLESLYWLGLKIRDGDWPDPEKLFLAQWTPYERRGPLPSREDVLKALLGWAKKHGLTQVSGETSLIIVPGYPFQLVDILLTNFHQPGSTLLLLVAAFVGDDWQKAYDHALANDYRFLSYGDGCLFYRKQS